MIFCATAIDVPVTICGTQVISAHNKKKAPPKINKIKTRQRNKFFFLGSVVSQNVNFQGHKQINELLSSQNNYVNWQIIVKIISPFCKVGR